MDKTEFLTIFPTYSNIDVVKQTLPTVIEETVNYENARLIVHDSTEPSHGQQEKWEYLRELEQKHSFFLILSTNLSMAHSRNMCLQVGQELYAPDYICMVEDDHGYKQGLIHTLVNSMKEYYGKVSPNGLRFGMFSGCAKHTNAVLEKLNDKNQYPSSDSDQFSVGGSNSCFRCAPSNHWQSVLKGYDTDEYLISNFQTAGLRWRNYHKGFTVLYVENGDLVFDIEAEGRGETQPGALRLWDKEYSASDKRSRYIGSGKNKDLSSREGHDKKRKTSKLLSMTKKLRVRKP